MDVPGLVKPCCSRPASSVAVTVGARCPRLKPWSNTPRIGRTRRDGVDHHQAVALCNAAWSGFDSSFRPLARRLPRVECRREASGSGARRSAHGLREPPGPWHRPALPPLAKPEGGSALLMANRFSVSARPCKPFLWRVSALRRPPYALDRVSGFSICFRTKRSSVWHTAFDSHDSFPRSSRLAS